MSKPMSAEEAREHVDQLQAHLDEGGKVSQRNVLDLIKIICDMLDRQTVDREALRKAILSELIKVLNGFVDEDTLDQSADRILAWVPAVKPSPSPWRPIEEAPKDGSWVLIYDPTFEEMPVTMGSYMASEDRDPKGRFKQGDWFGMEWDCLPSHFTPTHFIPLSALGIPGGEDE